MNDRLAAVIRTLNIITVSGKDNLDHLLGCIRVLEEIQQQMTESGKEEQHGENDSEL